MGLFKKIEKGEPDVKTSGTVAVRPSEENVGNQGATSDDAGVVTDGDATGGVVAGDAKKPGGLPWPSMEPDDVETKPVVGPIELPRGELYAEGHPWVKDVDGWYDKYPDMNAGQMSRDLMEYWKASGKEPDWADYQTLLDIRSKGDKSKKEKKKEWRRAKWADMINSIGDLLSSFVQFGIAKQGYPVTDMKPGQRESQVDRLRAADEKLRQQNFTDSVNLMLNQQKRQQTLADLKAKRETELAHKKAMKELEWTSPEYRVKLERAMIGLDNNKVEQVLKKLKVEEARLKAAGMDENKAYEEALHELTLEGKRLDNKNKVKKLNEPGKKKGSSVKPYSYSGNEYSDPYTAYRDAMIAQGKRPVDREHFAKDPTGNLAEANVDYTKK